MFFARSLAVLATISVIAPALADDFHEVPAQRYRGVEDGYGLISVHSGEIPAHLNWDLGFSADYANDPLVLRNADGNSVGSLVAHRVGGEFAFALGLLDYLALEAALPTLLFQQSGNFSEASVRDFQEPMPVGLSDLRVAAKLRILREDRHLVSLSLMPVVTLPLGYFQSSLADQPGSFLGERGPSLVPELALSSRRLFGTILAANLAYRLRPPVWVNELAVGEELLLRLGIGYNIGYLAPAVPLTLIGEYNAVLGMPSPLNDAKQNGGEWLLGLRFEPTPGLQIYFGGGGGNGIGFGVPSFRILGGLRYGTRSVDSDGDGIDDTVDGCVNKPEDRDGFEDSDGCPDNDNDGDGILDNADSCRDQAEDQDGFADDDGCPDNDNDGDTVIDSEDGCPLEAGPPEKQGCPAADTDGDGITDPRDTCPSKAEDRDGFDDRDGCPDPDNDRDGVLDTKDKCPNKPEDKDGYKDQDGCPDPDNDGDGVLDKNDKCPNDAAPPELAKRGNGCPAKDSDGDGLLDGVDKCPSDPEDKDQYEDEDGCPDPDNDRDGVPDAKDKCPNKPETINGIKDKDGCPDKGRQVVILTKEKIEIRQKVFFKTGSAKIRRRSFALLDQVAQVLRGHTEITKVRVEGHTDDRGKARYNKKLSQSRAESVAIYLIEAGIDPSRLQAVGYGEEKPISANKTKSGRERNRRVEFTIKTRKK